MTALLVDTHIFIWARLRPSQLTTGERQAIDVAATRFVSAVSLWEIAILQGRRRIESDRDLLVVPDEFIFLPVSPRHCTAVLELPHIHRDPFDRMLIAQARSEQIPLLTRDQTVATYRDYATILRNTSS